MALPRVWVTSAIYMCIPLAFEHMYIVTHASLSFFYFERPLYIRGISHLEISHMRTRWVLLTSLRRTGYVGRGGNNADGWACIESRETAVEDRKPDLLVPAICPSLRLRMRRHHRHLPATVHRLRLATAQTAWSVRSFSHTDFGHRTCHQASESNRRSLWFVEREN